MGCHTSTIKFCDVYEELKKILNVNQQTKSRTNSYESVSQRNAIYEAIIKCTTYRGEDSGGHAVSEIHRSSSSQIGVPFASLLQFAETRWGLTRLYPLNTYLCTRAAELINAIRKDNCTSFPRALPRWNFRLWLIFMCEFFHVLSIFQKAHAIPKSALKYLQDVKNGSVVVARIDEHKHVCGCLCLVDKKFLNKTYSFRINHVKLSDRLLQEVEQQVPFISTCDNTTLGGSIVSNAEGVESAVRSFLTLPFNSNIFLHIDSSSLAGGIPFIALVEWITLRHVLSLCGSEEDFTNYHIAVTKSEQLSLLHEDPHADAPEGLAIWKSLLHRLEWIESQLDDPCLNTSRDEMNSELKKEKSYLLDKLSSLFEHVSFGSFNLSQEAASEGCFRVFALGDVFINRAVHREMSNCAFQGALSASNDHVDGCCIDSCMCFRQYLESYIDLYDLYQTAVEVQKVNLGCGISPMSFTEFANVFDKIQRQRNLGRPLISLSSNFDFKSLFQLLANAGSSTEHLATVNFPDLCVLIVQQRFGFFRPLDNLRCFLGVGDPVSLRCSCVTDRVLLQMKACCNDARTNFVHSMATAVSLPLYLHSVYNATSHAVHFATLASTYTFPGAISEEECFLKWKSLLEESSQSNEMSATRLVAHALYASTALIRCLEKAKVDASQPDVSLQNSSGSPFDIVDQLCFFHGIRACACVLECSVEELMQDAAAIIISKERLFSNKMHLTLESRATNVVSPANESVEIQGFNSIVMINCEPHSQRNTARLGDLVYVCLFNYTRLHFASQPSLRDFYFQPLRYCAGDTLRLLLGSLLLNSEKELYRQFYRFSNVQQFVKFETAVDLNTFAHRIYEHYNTFFQRLALDEKDFVSWCLAAPFSIFRDAKNNVISARDFGAFLIFLAGCCIAQAAHLAYSNFPYDECGDISDSKNFIRYLLRLDGDGCEIQLEELKGETPKGEDIDAIFADLQAKSGNNDDSPLHLQHIIIWHAERLVLALGPPLIGNWFSIVSLLPYSSSIEHDRARQKIIQKLVEAIAAHINYLPTSLLAQLLADDYQLNQLQIPQQPEKKNSIETYTEWIIRCVKVTNSLVGESNLSGASLHTDNLRFLLQYIHHSLVAFYACEEVKKEIDASNFVKYQNEDKEATEENVYTEKFFQHAYIQLLKELEAPLFCIDELQTLSNNMKSTSIDSAYVAHHTASTLVAHACSGYIESNQYSQKNDKAGHSHPGELARRKFKNPLQEKKLDYWQHLRWLLAFGDSPQQRTRRSDLFAQLDCQNRGYLSFSDLCRGFEDVLHLKNYYSNIEPIVFRAFFAAVEVSGMKKNTIYVDSSEECYITPYEFCACLYYVYHYIELYFMFDALTCVSVITSKDEASAGLVAGKSYDTFGLNGSTRHRGVVVPETGLEKLDSIHANVTDNVEAIEVLARTSPLDLAQKAIPMEKKVSRAQFVASFRLLRSWGLRSEDLGEVFRTIDRHSRERGYTYFTSFAIWASKVGLRADGDEDGSEETDEL